MQLDMREEDFVLRSDRVSCRIIYRMGQWGRALKKKITLVIRGKKKIRKMNDDDNESQLTSIV